MRFTLSFLLVISSQWCFAQLQIGKFLVNGKPRTFSRDTIQLKAGDNDLILEFKSIKADSVSYLYRLEGVDNEWIESRYPVSRYVGLDAGNYIYHIKAQAGGRQLSQSEIYIKKEQGFWNQWWFIPSIVVYILVLIGVSIYLFLLYDFRQKLRMQHVRNKIAADLHDEVGSNLNSIAIFVEVLRKNAPPEMLPVLEKIIANSKESVSLMQDTVWTINPKNDSIYKLFDRMESFASGVLSSRDIGFDFKVETDLGQVNFTMDQRKSVYLIFKEAINNIVKHAEASMVWVHVSRSRDTVHIGIEDNGIGFDMAAESNGNGLANFRDRANEAGIQLFIESEKGKGTRLKTDIAL
ncbi:ATP-binding protein [Dyadobacter fanqingshengii]|uniref:histidine kinase n=1 Tax=Dyadobacter fanqingshengii TaxID=2906443 RepID=A0A9X1TAP0_9BACT|nr:ATP-binding protein [Dyadobacter fanqingshengii]MCF0041119.1 histidine kinase [Dyadobacter fanqingshengii]MCF2505772.1 histidine kinase [Dyadobacter fanqingshengii]USJ37154.1 histidine kinase [Dyadobacter fanqingshengii]